MADDPTRLLAEIKGEVGETRGIVSEVRSELREHRREDRTELRMISERLDHLAQRQAGADAVNDRRRHDETKRAGVIAALIAGFVSLCGQLIPHWFK